MADSSVAVTPGAGASIDTRTETENGNHRQVVVIGDPSTNTGVAPVSATTGLLVNISNATLAVTGTFWQATQPVSLASVPSHPVTNAGTFVVQIDGLALTALQNTDSNTSSTANRIGDTADAAATAGSTGSVSAKLRLMTTQLNTITGHVDGIEGTLTNIQTAVQLMDNSSFADDAAFTVGSSGVTAVGLLADETSTDSVDEGDAGIPRMTLNRQAIVTVRPNASGEGLDIFRSLDLDETEEDVKTTAGKVYGWFITNLAASTRYIKFYNATAASVTVGTTTPVMTIPLEADQASNIEFTNGIPFSTAICVAATTGLADNDTGAPGANEVVVNIFYK